MPSISSKGVEALAQDNGGVRTVVFDQGVGLKKGEAVLQPKSQYGVCAGLVLMWLSSRKSGTTSTVFGVKYSTALFKFAERSMQFGAGSVVDQAAVDKAAAAFSLTRASARVTVGNKTIAKWVINGPSSQVYIAIGPMTSGKPNHAVAAYVKNGKFLFFEPNYGEFSLPDSLKFANFLNDYLSSNNKVAYYLNYFR